MWLQNRTRDQEALSCTTPVTSQTQKIPRKEDFSQLQTPHRERDIQLRERAEKNTACLFLYTNTTSSMWMRTKTLRERKSLILNGMKKLSPVDILLHDYNALQHTRNISYSKLNQNNLKPPRIKREALGTPSNHTHNSKYLIQTYLKPKNTTNNIKTMNQWSNHSFNFSSVPSL